MNLQVPSGWVEVTEAEAGDLLQNLNYRRTAFCGGEMYSVPGWRCGSSVLESGVTVSWDQDVIARKMDNSWWLDPVFFRSNCMQPKMQTA